MRRSASYLVLACFSASIVALGCSGKADTKLPSYVPPTAPPPGDPGDTPASGEVPEGSACVVTEQPEGANALVLTGTLLAPQGLVEKGDVAIGPDGRIACVGESCASWEGYATATKITCEGGVISPSLINAHDHIDYSGFQPYEDSKVRFVHRNEWRADNSPLPAARGNAPDDIVIGAELRFLMGGATSTVTSGGVPGLLRNFSGSAADLLGLDAYGVVPGQFDTFPLGDSQKTEPIVGGRACRDYTKTPKPRSEHYFPHIAEGINAGAKGELTCLSGEKNVVKAGTGIIHAIGIDAEQAQLIKDRGAKVIWSPRSNIFLYGNTAPVTLLKRLGVTIALGTDWLPSGSMNMLREIACADFLNTAYFDKAFSDQDLWEMVTRNAAKVVGAYNEQENRYVVGSLEVGAVADIAVFEGRVHKGYRAPIAAASEDVLLVLRAGKVMYGEAALVDAAAPPDACEALDVCGVARKACIKNDNQAGVTVEALVGKMGTAFGQLYPLFACRGQTPYREPTCVPYRSEYPDGTSAKDGDGDGIPDAEDNCPRVFNPPRPMDPAGAQADEDGDKIGDACDESPRGGI